MIALDSHTLLIATALIHALGGVLVYTGRDQLSGHRAETFWLAGSLLMAGILLAGIYVACCLMHPLSLLPLALFIGLKNELLGKSLSRLTENPRPWWSGSRASLLQSALLLSGVLLLDPHQHIQIAFIAISSWFFAGQARLLLCKAHRRGSSAKLLGSSYILMSVYLLAYAFSLLLQPELNPRPSHALLLITLASAILLQMGYIQVQREQQYRQLSRLAALDPLTGIFNRRTFFDLAARQHALHLRQQRSLSFLLIDLDYFKMINDEYGHSHGDQALRAVAECLADEVRQGDIFARIGGEEFCLLLPDTGLPGARQVAEKLGSAISRISVSPQTPERNLTASIGVACMSPDSPQPWQALFELADQRLYRAKSAGRNQVRWQD